MTNDISAIVGADVSRETRDRLEAYVALLTDENKRQNLIGGSTLNDLWNRHIIDSAQLLRYLPASTSADIGSGAGLPGLVIGILSPAPISLIEPRRLRSDFLQHCVNKLNLPNVTVVPAKAERAQGRFDAITARAVASVDTLFASAHHLSHPETIWVLPKGQRGQLELEAAQASWQGSFRTVPSITEGEAVIILASHVSPKRKGRA